MLSSLPLDIDRSSKTCKSVADSWDVPRCICILKTQKYFSVRFDTSSCVDRLVHKKDRTKERKHYSRQLPQQIEQAAAKSNYDSHGRRRQLRIGQNDLSKRNPRPAQVRVSETGESVAGRSAMPIIDHLELTQFLILCPFCLIQYHLMRPYTIVASVPHFDPKRLPYWDIYQREDTANTIKAGGTINGKFMAGLSGGQRKMLMFEIICQRVNGQRELLIVLDEPFAGVTDDFVPYFTERLEKLKEHHYVLIVTNDHIEALTSLADNTIRVSAVNRSIVDVTSNATDTVRSIARDKAIAALSTGKAYEAPQTTSDDLQFFYNVDVKGDSQLANLVVFVTVGFGIFAASFWDSPESAAQFVLIASQMLPFLTMNPYILGLVGWRAAMSEEARALVHSSSLMNINLKFILSITIFFAIITMEFSIINLVLSGPSLNTNTIRFFFMLLCDGWTLIFPQIWLGLYSQLQLQMVQTLGSVPFLYMIFFSTTFSPGNTGIPVLKELRYLSTRFYFFCEISVGESLLEGCPESSTTNLLLTIATTFVTSILFIACVLARRHSKNCKRDLAQIFIKKMAQDDEFRSFQKSLLGISGVDDVTGDSEVDANEACPTRP